MKTDRQRAYLALLITAVIWGLAPPIIKHTLVFISPLEFLFYRFLIASLFFFFPLWQQLKKQPPTRQEAVQYFLLGFLGTPLTLWLLFTGLAKTSAINGSIIWVIAPLLVVVGGGLFLKEKITCLEKTGILMTLTGALVTVIQPLGQNDLLSGSHLKGNFLVLAGTSVWALFTLLAKKQHQLDAFILAASSFFIGLFFFLPFWLAHGPAWPVLSAWPGILYMAILGSAIAYFTYLYGVAKIEASEATIFTYLQPLFGVTLAFFWLKETVTPLFLLGAFLIISGVFVCQKKEPVVK